jgi:hypothetical protein
MTEPNSPTTSAKGNDPSVEDAEAPKGKLITDDPAFDPSWDLKAAQATAVPEAEQKVVAPAPEQVAAPVESKPEVEEKTPEIQPKKESAVTPLPPIPAGTLPPKQPVAGAVTPIPAPVKQTEKEVKKKSKIIWGDVLSCWVLGIGAILILVLILLFIVAKSGLVNIPFVSGWLYHAPTPERYVTTESMNWDDFRALATSRLIAQGLDSEPPILLELTEGEFTGLLKGVIEDGLRSTSYKAEIAQVAFLPESVELYFYLTWRDFFTFEILTHLVPVVEDDGTLRFEVADARFGDLPLPGMWVLRLVGYFFARDVGAWRIVLSNGYGIQSAALIPSSIQLFIGPVSSQ